MPYRPTCPVRDCNRTYAAGKLMCPMHWGAVPPHLQRAVYAALRVWRNVGDDSAYQALMSAQHDAIESV